jgi:hypothetical protein
LLLGTLGWAAFQNLAASAAKVKGTGMEDVRAALKQPKEEIDQLLKSEAALNKIASGFTNAESDHAFWMDLLGEVRGAFASEAVWIVDLEPLAGYDPLAEGETAGKAKTKSGKPVVKSDFATATYGASSLSDIRIEDAAPVVKGKPGAAAASKEVTANAVRIKGFWRETSKNQGQNVVSELLKNLREKSGSFQFKVKNPKGGTEIVLSDDRVLDITVAGKPGELGFPFEITLPLAREVAVK